LLLIAPFELILFVNLGGALAVRLSPSRIFLLPMEHQIMKPATLPNPFFEKPQAFSLATQLEALSVVASLVLTQIATDARQVELSHEQRADLVRLEMALCDVLNAIKTPT
jgi:hypothetical protein